MRLRSPSVCSAGIVTNLVRCVEATQFARTFDPHKAGRGNPIIFRESVSRIDEVRIVAYDEFDRFDYIDMVEDRMMKSYTDITLIGNQTTLVDVDVNLHSNVVLVKRDDITITNYGILKHENNCEISQSKIISNAQ